jgi:hypothetical protein
MADLNELTEKYVKLTELNIASRLPDLSITLVEASATAKE